jgi:SAM-dependent methyltransferase
MTDWGLGSYERTAMQLAPAAGAAVEAAEILPGDRVLDVGCGTGNAALLAAMHGARVTGLDPAVRLLEVARGRAASAGIEADWVRGDALDLPFVDGTFDATLSVFGVIFAAPPEQAVAELVRVTAPEGRIVLTTWVGDGALANATGLVRSAIAAAMQDGATTEAAATAAAATGEGATGGGDADGGAGGDAAPASAPARTLDWGDEEDLRALFAPHGVVPEADRFPHAFTAESATALADEWLALHPLWLSARPILGEEAYAALRAPLIEALEAGNEDPQAFRVTSTALLVRADLA